MRYLKKYNEKDIAFSVEYEIPYHDVLYELDMIKKKHKIDLLPYINELDILRYELSEYYEEFLRRDGLNRYTFAYFIENDLYVDDLFSDLLGLRYGDRFSFQEELVRTLSNKDINSISHLLGESIIEDYKHLFDVMPDVVSIEDVKDEVQQITENKNDYIPIKVVLEVKYDTFYSTMKYIFGEDAPFLENKNISKKLIKCMKNAFKIGIKNSDMYYILDSQKEYIEYLKSENFGNIIGEDYPSYLIPLDKKFGINEKIKEKYYYIFDSEDLGLL